MCKKTSGQKLDQRTNCTVWCSRTKEQVQELSYCKQIARQLHTQYVEGK